MSQGLLPIDDHEENLTGKVYSNLLDLKPFFESEDVYVVLKLPKEFPNYYDYTDIDILCRNREAFLLHLLRVGKAYKKRGFQIRINRNNGLLHVDFYPQKAERLNLRFDLLDSLSYKKFVIDPKYSDIILDSRQNISRNGVGVQVPSLEHDLTIRFLEYIEWKDSRPEKVKHLEYIKNFNNFDFVDVVNKYTNLNVIVEVEGGKTNLNVSIKTPEEITKIHSTKKKQQKYYNLSQTCQITNLNIIYEQYFGQRTNGCFVEIGAFDGEYTSNTSGLADIGWVGYYIEPVPIFFQRCKARHSKNKNITVSQYAIGAGPETVEVNVGGPLSTVSDAMKENFESLEWARGNFVQDKKIMVEQLLLEDYLNKHGVKSHFELLIIDVEGYEWNVLRNFDLKKWRPQMVIIELHDQNDDYLLIREDCNNIVQYFDNHYYKVIYKDFTNTIYVPKDSFPIGEVQNNLKKGESLFAKGRMKQAEICFFDILKNDPHNTEAYNNIGVIAFQNGDMEKAIDFFVRCLQIDNFNKDAILNLSVIHRKLDRLPELIPYLEKMIKKYPNVREITSLFQAATRNDRLKSNRTSESRLDYFIIWGHGLEHVDSILDIIRNTPEFEIITIRKYRIGSIADFVHKLYESDTVPFQHLVDKTRYLIKTRPEIMVVLVMNKSPREKYFGQGPFRHIQCEVVKEVKETIRNRFNPRINGKRSEDHIIHGSDYESQVDHLLKMINLGSIDYFKRNPNRFLAVPYHIQPFNEFLIKIIPTGEIHCNILKGNADSHRAELCSIESTPHYEYLLGNVKPYDEYLETFGGILLTDDHFSQSFDKLAKDFRYLTPPNQNKYILVSQIGPHKYCVVDGVHRLAILKKQNVQQVTVALVQFGEAEKLPDEKIFG